MALTGEFTSIHGVQWKVEIVGAGDGTLVLPADSPLVVEWTDKSVEDVICGSIATLKIESQSDRQYIGLYTEKVGDVMLKVYKNGSLWWLGSLDPEFYEEPYSRNKYYDVSLTFSDFGQLGRLAFNMTNRVKMSTVLNDALERLGLEDLPIDKTYISGTIGSVKASPENLMVESANFYDEEGDAEKMDAVIEAMFQSLGLKMMQRAGKIYLFDMNGVAKNSPQSEVYWAGTDARLGVDKVYNDVKIVYSPYVMSNLLDGELDLSPNMSNLGGEGTNYHTYYKGYHYDSDDEYDQKKEGDKDFTLYTNLTSDKYVATAAPICAMRKIYGGEDSEFAAGVYVLQDPASSTVDRHEYATTDYTQENAVTYSLIKSKKVIIPEGNNCLIRLIVNMFCDVRYNPFREGDKTNEKGNYENSILAGVGSLIAAPIRIRLYDADGNVLYHYMNNENRDLSLEEDTGAKFDYRGYWQAGDYKTNNVDKGNPAVALENQGFAFIAWYEPTSHAVSVINNGWKENYQYFNSRYSVDSVDPLIASAPAGQYISYPPVGGYLEVEVFGALKTWCSALPNTHSSDWLDDHFDTYVRWFMVKAPIIEFCETISPYNTISSDDIEYKGVLDADAADDLTIDTKCGTSLADLPCARGAIMDSSGNQVHSMTRNGITDQPENLLIGTLFSAYAKRHTKLSGTIRTKGTFGVLTDANTTGKFWPKSEEADVFVDESSITMVECGQDEYHGV